jgi:glycine cleavage system H protein
LPILSGRIGRRIASKENWTTCNTTSRKPGLHRPGDLFLLVEMLDDLVFMMGNFAARIPADRLYAENHVWLLPLAGAYRVGFTAYSVRLLQDVYFLSWSIDPETAVRRKQEIGEIESSKAVSSLFAPRDGRVLTFNESLLNDPSAINTDNYGEGWLFEFETGAELLTPQAYMALLESGWEKTQQMIKGQMNE